MKLTKLILLMSLVAAANLAGAQDNDVVVDRPPQPPPPPQIDPTTGLVRAERQLEDQKEQLARAAKSVAASQKAVALAQAKAGEPGRYSDRLTTIIRRGGQARALVIPKDSSDAKSISEMEEDLNIMAHLLDKASGEKGPHAMGISVYGPPSVGGGSQNLFIEGTGAIFFLTANYPLLPPKAKEKDSESREKPLSDWEVAQKELAGGGKSRPGEPFSLFEDREVWMVNPPGASIEYDADRVEELKRDLIGALKNASNIRKLKNDETVTVVVTGAGPGMGNRTIKASTGGGGGSGGSSDSGERPVRVERSERSSVGSPAKLVLRVKKSDAEAFQNGKLNADEFRKKVNVMIY